MAVCLVSFGLPKIFFSSPVFHLGLCSGDLNVDFLVVETGLVYQEVWSLFSACGCNSDHSLSSWIKSLSEGIVVSNNK